MRGDTMTKQAQARCDALRQVARERAEKKHSLIVGNNYADIFGRPEGDQIVYLGGIKFRLSCVSTGRGGEQDSQGTYDKIYDYINSPRISMGM